METTIRRRTEDDTGRAKIQEQRLVMSGFHEWIRTICFKKPTDEAYELARLAWNCATSVERDRCAIVGGREAEKCNLPDGQRVADAIRQDL